MLPLFTIVIQSEAKTPLQQAIQRFIFALINLSTLS